MEQLKCFFICILSLFAVVVSAQNKIQTDYDKAKNLNYRQEYLKAADAFKKVQGLAQQAGDHEMYINSTLAAGECYYILNLTTQLKSELDTAKKALALYADSFNDSVSLSIKEGVTKLEASYLYCLFNADLGSPYGAEKAYRQCLAILDTLNKNFIFDIAEPSAIIHRELLSLYYRMGEYNRALTEANIVYYYYAFRTGYDKTRSDADIYFNRRFVDAIRSRAMVLARLKRFDEAEETLSILPKSCQQDPSILRVKGKILMMRSDIDGKDRRGEAMGYYDQYIRIEKKRLNEQMDKMTDAQREQYWLSMHDFLFDCYRLGDYASEMLYDLALYSKGYLLEYKNKKAKTYTWKDIQNCLDAHTCTIEFVQYNGYEDRKQLGALVVTKKCPSPRFVHIADLDALRYSTVGNTYLQTAVISSGQEAKDWIYNDTAFFSKIWTKALMDATDGATKIYFAADGILHQLAIEYMMTDPNRSCRRLTSTRMLAKAYKLVNTRKMLLFGGIDYGYCQPSTMPGNDELAYTFLQPYNKGLQYLPGTKSEVESVARMRQEKNDLVLTGQNATDSAFIANASQYPLILISTHGFFLGEMLDGTDMRPPVSDNSMSKSGLAFAGSKYALADTTHDPSLPDGILSAKELSQLSLDSVSLIVLSACQTGLGTITADGVYGVQRALKQAGVKTMIVSLWSVDDLATSILMQNFFRNLQAAGEAPDIYEAFMLARHQLMTEEYLVFDSASMSTKKKVKFAAPRYANAFIMIDVK